MRSVVLAVVLGLGLEFGSARAEPPPLSAYAQAPSIEQAALSPSGRLLAVVARDANGAGAVYVTQIGGPQLMAAPITDATVGRLQWAGEDILLVDVSNPNGKEPLWTYPSVGYAIDIPARKVTRLGDLPTTVRKVSDDPQHSGPRWFGYYVGWPGGGAWGLFKRDLETGSAVTTRPIAESPGGVAAAQWSIDQAGAPNARLDYDPTATHWTVTSIGLKRVVARGGGDVDCTCISVLETGRTGDTAVVRTRGDDGYMTLLEVSLTAEGPARPLTQGREVTHVWTDPDTGLLVGYTWSDDHDHYVFFDLSVQQRADAALADVRRSRVNLVSASRDFLRFIAYSDGGDDSGSYWLVDLPTGEAVSLGSVYPQVPPAATGARSVFRYTASDGLSLDAMLTLPPGRQPKGLPLLVLVHGGPEERATPDFNWIAQAFASRGYAVLEPNFRGSSGYGKAFREAGFGQWGRRMQTDLSDGVDALAATGVVDPKRVCIMGSGYGGYAAAAGVTVQHGRYRCAVAHQGALDLRDLLKRMRDSPVRRETLYWEQLLGTSKVTADLEAVSPVSRAGDADAPVLLIDTMQEEDLVAEGPAMEQALRKVGKPVERADIASYDESAHSVATRTALLTAAVGFVEKYNPSDAR